jgi:hypothetical protein
MEMTLMADQPRFAALDVSLEKTTICVMSLDGIIRREAVLLTDPDAIATWLAVDQGKLERIGLEAGPLSEMAGARAGRSRHHGGADGDAANTSGTVSP